MEEAFWRQRWDSQQIGFHEPGVHRFLERFAPRLELGRVLVPLCGKSIDMDALAARGHRVTGVELVERAVHDYFGERGLVPELIVVGSHEIYQAGVHEAGSVRLVRGDMLSYADETPFDSVYDRAALIALAPGQRALYATRLAQLLRPRGTMLLVTLEHDAPSGPPFGIPRSEVEQLFAASFSIEEVAREDVSEKSPQLRSKGATFVSECGYLLTRVA